MCRLAYGALGELTPAVLLHLRERFVFEESGRAQREDDLLFDFADFQAIGQADQGGAEIELGVLPVEELQALNEHRGDDEHRVGELVGIANEEAWMLGGGRRHEVQVEAQTGQYLCQTSS